MGRREELDLWEDALEIADNASLPNGVQVKIEFVDEDEPGGFR